MTDLHPAANAAAGQWLLRPDVDWQVLVRYGPPDFQAYVRITLADRDGADPRGEDPALRLALATLARFTATPDSGYAAIWEGWMGGAPAPAAPRVQIPHRAMLLFTGPVDVLRDAPALAWYGSAQGCFQEPHLVWPEDHQWCLACDVDEEIEFSVGCSDEAAEALSRALPGAVRRVRYGESAPLHGDEGFASVLVARLDQERATLSSRVSRLADDMAALIAASRDSNADDEHDPEGQTIAFERSQLSAVTNQAQEHLVEIEAALGRLAAGTYGVCEVCHRIIDAARLEARPTARTCVHHVPGRRA